jgi:hypothetical protein
MRIVLQGEASYQDPLFGLLISTVFWRKPKTNSHPEEWTGDIKYGPFQRTILRFAGRFEVLRLEDTWSVLLARFLVAFTSFFLAKVMVSVALLPLVSNRN